MGVAHAVVGGDAGRGVGVAQLHERGTDDRQALGIGHQDAGPSAGEIPGYVLLVDRGRQCALLPEAQYRDGAAAFILDIRWRYGVVGHHRLAVESQHAPASGQAADALADLRVGCVEILRSRAGGRDNGIHPLACRIRLAVVFCDAVPLGGGSHYPVRERRNRLIKDVLVSDLARRHQPGEIASGPAGVLGGSRQVHGGGEVGQVVEPGRQHGRGRGLRGAALGILVAVGQPRGYEQGVGRIELGLPHHPVRGREQHVVAARGLAGDVDGLDGGGRAGERGGSRDIDDVPRGRDLSRRGGESAGGGGGFTADVVHQYRVEPVVAVGAGLDAIHCFDQREQGRVAGPIVAIRAGSGDVGHHDGFDAAFPGLGGLGGRAPCGIQAVRGEGLWHVARQLRHRAGGVVRGQLRGAVGTGRHRPRPDVAGPQQHMHAEQPVAVVGAAEAHVHHLAVVPIHVHQVQHGHLAILRGEVGDQQGMAGLAFHHPGGGGIGIAQLRAGGDGAGSGDDARMGCAGDGQRAEQGSGSPGNGVDSFHGFSLHGWGLRAAACRCRPVGLACGM